MVAATVYTYHQVNASDGAVQDAAPSKEEATPLRTMSRRSPGWSKARIATIFSVVSVFLSLVPIALVGAAYARDRDRQGPARLDISINPSSYDTNSQPWTGYGPLYEAGPGLIKANVPNAHVYGGGSGSIDYLFEIPAFSGSTVNLSAYLSADESQYHSGAADRYSDVEVVMNGSVIGTRRVTPDEGRGANYEWSFPARLIRVGKNEISFTVKPDGAFSNGLCIYGEAVMPGYPNRSIRLQTR
jgi:hypothetical protein